jgi:hypothetical protein
MCQALQLLEQLEQILARWHTPQQDSSVKQKMADILACTTVKRTA